MTGNLLIVDDDPAIRDVFSLLLAEHGYTVHAAPGGKECIEYLKGVQPDLVMLDIMMYPMDGWETLTAIRTDMRTRAIPAIMFSGKNPSDDEIWRYGGWIEDYLMKPINIQTITNALDDIFERSRARIQERECILLSGADPEMVDEYFILRSALYIHSKFARRGQSGNPAPDLRVQPQQVRYEELERILTSHRTPGAPVVGKEAT